jgi:hypothetical protein
MINENGTSVGEPFALEDKRNPPPSPYLAAGSPQTCARCNGGFRLHDGRLSCWRGADARYYCSEECTTVVRRKKRAA